MGFIPLLRKSSWTRGDRNIEESRPNIMIIKKTINSVKIFQLARDYRAEWTILATKWMGSIKKWKGSMRLLEFSLRILKNLHKFLISRTSIFFVIKVEAVQRKVG